MSKIKATVDFSNYAAAKLAPVAQTIQTQMTANAATFPAPPVAMPALQGDIDAFNTRLAARASGARADTIAFNLARHDLEVALGELGGYVNSVAKGDATIIAQSGFPSYDTARTVDTSAPAAPQDVVLRQGDVSGSYVARCHPQRANPMNELQSCTGDLNVEANWHYTLMFSGGKATVNGIPPGTTIWVRIRTAGLKGIMGAWSDPAKIIVV